ncbi:hypothetical protein FB451DRAFT_1344170 [Mycena latifolia]|nr:hypothetical protein FB451DRAFT_1344170 [Mycena latifolia]
MHAITEYTPCVGGYAGTEEGNTYSCINLVLYSFTPHTDLGCATQFGNDIWGWSHTEAGVTREFALVGESNGTAFVETVVDIRRDIKVIWNYTYIGSEAIGHGIQVFDLNKKNLIMAVGSIPRNHSCAASLIFVDVTDSTNPTSVGCAAVGGYVHEYRPVLDLLGPHTEYVGDDVCCAFNEDYFTIYNITDPADAIVISSTPYSGISYAHQGWVVDEYDQSYLLDDELDEYHQCGWANNSHTMTEPVLTGHYSSPVKSIDHNLYVHNGWAYESNYGNCLRVVDVSSVAKDPTGGAFIEVAFFDAHPEDDAAGGEAKAAGSWSVYPYFESGYIQLDRAWAVCCQV